MFFQTNDDMVSDYKFELKNDIKLLNGKTFQIVEKEDSDSNYVCRLDSTEVSLPLYVRNRCSGDKIAVKNLNGSKKIKDIFIDSKIPLKDRESWPILVDSNDTILWVPGLKKSKYNKEKNGKYDIIIRYD